MYNIFIQLQKLKRGATPSPTIETVKKIADALGISIDNLFK
ncbi:MAG: helix-turn-helix domain-containing protein [Patescibacteria group bacterium]